MKPSVFVDAVVVREDRGESYIILRLDDFIEDFKKYLELKEKGIPARLFYNEQDKLTVESGVAPVVPVVTTNQTNYNNSTYLNSANIANMSMNEIIYGNR